MESAFTTTLSESDWDPRLGGWHCEALNIPGSVLQALFAGGRQIDPREFQRDGQTIKWSGDRHPSELLARIALTVDLSKLEDEKLGLERQKLALEKEKLRSEKFWKMASAIGSVLAFVAGLLLPIGKSLPHPFSSSATAQTVPQVVPTQVAKLPAETSDDADFDLLKDISVFDLRGWKPVPADAKDSRYSPANYTNYLHLRKKTAAKTYVIRFGTTGYAIDARSMSHSGTLYTTATKKDPELKEYALEVDVSSEPIGKDFLLVIEGTYWNGFSNPEKEFASTYTNKDMMSLGELGLLVLFPEQKPFKTFELLQRTELAAKFTSMTENSKFYPDSGKQFIYWSVTNRRPSTEYKIEWGW